MRNIKLTLEYDGTRYCGWQNQKNALSVQEVMEKTLKKILREKVGLIGSGRTDSGVHAYGQVANFRTASRIPLSNLKAALNANLPEDIAVRDIREASHGFNARHDAKSKIYRYVIATGGWISPFFRKYSFYTPFKLDAGMMAKAAKALLGRHDFSSFMGSNGCAKTTVRTVKNVSVRKEGPRIFIDIEADGFLYNMVRAIAGTLIEVGRGKVPAGTIKEILRAKKRTAKSPTAPACGLILLKVKYR